MEQEKLLDDFFREYFSIKEGGVPVKISPYPHDVPQPFGDLLKSILDGYSIPEFCKKAEVNIYALEDLFENEYVPDMNLLNRILSALPEYRDLLIASYYETVFTPVIVGKPVRGKIVRKPDKDSIEDAEIIKEILKGDTDKIERLVKKYGAWVRHIIATYVSGENYSLIDDIYQEVWIKVMKKLPTHYEEKYRFKYWLSVVTRNHTKSVLKKKEKLDLQEYDSPYENLELFEALDYCISQLSSEERKLIEQRYWKKKKLKEIAKEMGLSQGAVSIRIKKITERLKQCLEKII